MRTKEQTHFPKRFDQVFKLYKPLHSQLWAQLGETQYSIKKSTNVHFLITITKLRGGVWCMMMLHGRFVDAPQILLCKLKWQKLENMKGTPNNTHACTTFFNGQLFWFDLAGTCQSGYSEKWITQCVNIGPTSHGVPNPKSQVKSHSC